MRFVIKQKFFSFGNDFTIEDEDGNAVFEVDGRVFSLGDQLAIRDTQGNEVAHIRQRLFSWGPAYEITSGGAPLATVKKQLFTFFKCRFNVDVPGPDDLEAVGDFLDHEYTFTRHGERAAVVSKRWFSFRDVYGIDIAHAQDVVPVLASVVVIDLVCHDNKHD